MPALPPAWIRSPLRALRQRFRPAVRNDAGLAGTVRQHFRHKAAAQGYTLSPGQLQVIEHMAKQAARLESGQARSLYLHGAVGRGKSWLLDGYYQALPQTNKHRVHFHDFFAHLHQGMFEHRHQDDALGCTLDQLLQSCQVLCFDEFHVHDIGDAMLLTRLFSALFERNVFVVLTSNYAPEGLLPNPLYHERFLPVIRLINSRMLVMEVGGDIDFRSLPANRAHQRFTQGHYVWPGTAEQRLALALPETQPLTLDINHRPLRALASQDRQVHFSFVDLCERATAVVDYLELASRYDRWIIDDLEDLAECSLAAQQRFVNLVDVLYDQDCELVLIGRYPLEQSLGGAIADLMRSRSRLGQLHQIGTTVL